MRIIVRSNVLTLMKNQFDILSCILKRIIHQLELLSANVRIVQTMNNQRRAIKLLYVEVDAVPALPSLPAV